MSRPKKTDKERIEELKAKNKNLSLWAETLSAKLEASKAEALQWREAALLSKELASKLQEECEKAQALARELLDARRADWEEYKSKLAKAENRTIFEHPADHSDYSEITHKRNWKSRRRRFR